MKLSIIIVDIGELHFLGPCLSAIFEHTKGIEFEVIVVDNMSTDRSREWLAREYPAVKVVTSAERLGFAAANNRAFPHASGEYLLLLNPDTEVIGSALATTVGFMDAHPQCGIAGCRLIYADGSVQPSVRGFPTVWNTFLEATFLHLLVPRDRIVGARGITRFDNRVTAEVEWLIGACFMIRRSVMERLGPLDEQFWIYGEEVDYCRRAKNAGFETWYIADASVVHHWQGMTAFTLRLIVWLHIGQKLYVDKHFEGVRKYAIMYLRYCGAAARAVVYPLAACVTFKKSLFVKGYYFAMALVKLLTLRLRYQKNFTGKVTPWTEYL